MQFAHTTRGDRLAFVDETWAEVGYRVRPLRSLLFVRTEPPPTQIGSIILPPKLQGFYGPLPAGTVITAVVLSSGPNCDAQPGDIVTFIRTPFARWLDFKDGSKVGWIPEGELFYKFVDEDAEQ